MNIFANAVRRGMWTTVALAAVLTPTACGPDSGRPGARAGPGTVHRDSAGVAIADAVAPVWGEGDGWTVVEPPVLEIGVATGDPDYQLADVTGAARLASGDIVVAVQGSMELRWFSEDGAFVRRAGGAGRAPGGLPLARHAAKLVKQARFLEEQADMLARRLEPLARVLDVDPDDLGGWRSLLDNGRSSDTAATRATATTNSTTESTA